MRGKEMENKKNIITAEGMFKYFDDEPALIVEGMNFEKTFYGDEARELFKKLIGVTTIEKAKTIVKGITDRK